MNSTLLVCRNIKKSFMIKGTELLVLQNICLEINRGEKVLISGRSGQGKSVLLSLLSGMDLPSSGDIWFNGTWFSSISLMNLAKLRCTEIGIIFQNLNLVPSWTALENVEASLMGIINNSDQRRKIAVNILEEICLGNRLNHLPSEMSMGEQQRTAIARTLVRKPKLILADEPTGDLDNESADVIINLLYSYARKSNAALLVTSHGHFPGQDFDQTFTLHNGLMKEAPALSLTRN